MGSVSIGQILLSAYGWASFGMYLYLVSSIIVWRRGANSAKQQFKASYYLIFILQAVADFYAFLSIEVIQKPARFNYFDISEETLQSFAVLSYANIMISSSVINCGHIVIAVNRWTAFCKPMSHEKIWTRTTIFASVCGLWSIFIIYSVVVIYHFDDTVSFVANKDGEFTVSSSALNRSFSIVNCVRGGATILLCSVFYSAAIMKCHRSVQKKTVLERRLLFCALASSAGFLPNFLGTVFLVTNSRNAATDTLAIFVIDFWCHLCCLFAYFGFEEAVIIVKPQQCTLRFKKLGARRVQITHFK